MKNILDIKSPCCSQARAVKSEFGLKNHGLKNLGTVFWNLPTEALYEEALFRREGALVTGGALVVNTGKHTARAASDKFIVCEPSSQNLIWWGEYNRPFDPEKFSLLYARLLGYLQGHDLFVQDVYACAHPQYRLPVRIITEKAWHSLFARNMFIKPKTHDEMRRFVPQFVLICAPDFVSAPEIDSTASETFIVVDFFKRVAIIGGTAYAGEIKKTVFTVLNHLLVFEGVLPMHCSANMGQNGDVALFFGLSGTGKTSLSADPKRSLIGDDEHGWGEDGVFNFEDGCYAKVIALSPKAEPQIWQAIRKFGAILENVVFDPVTRLTDLDDDRFTENTRASYPLDFIENAQPQRMGGHPSNIIMLTCDASGVMPPIAKLSVAQALYHFISGYTAKVSGTEIGMKREPEITFSACFGAPFMVRHPSVYAELLKAKILRHGTRCWLVNTGWVGGPYGVGKRISIHYTRAMLDAVLSSKLEDVPYRRDPVFGFEVPTKCPNVPDEILDPSNAWPDKQAYNQRYRDLASRFIQNFKKFALDCPKEVIKAGPTI